MTPFSPRDNSSRTEPGSAFYQGRARNFPQFFLRISRFAERVLQVFLSFSKIRFPNWEPLVYGMFFTLKGYKTSSMKTTIKQTSPGEVYEGFHLMGTIVLVLLFLALVAG